MKALSLSLFLCLVSLLVKAQPTMDLTVSVSPYPETSLPNGGSQTSPFPIPQGTVQSFTFKIKNTGTTDLTLSKTGGVYISLSGSGATEVVVDESTISATIAAGSYTSFTVTNKSTTAAGSYSVTLSIANNDATKNPYTGTVNYTISPATAVISAKDAGMTLSPIPSADGNINITGNVLVSKIMVYGLNGTSEEFSGGMSFHTRQKGLLIVNVYTDKGVVEEKLMVQ